MKLVFHLFMVVSALLISVVNVSAQWTSKTSFGNDFVYGGADSNGNNELCFSFGGLGGGCVAMDK